MRTLILLSSLIVLAGCTGSVKRLHDLNPPADNFDSALASEYGAYADSETEQGRWLAGNYYAGKGLRALKGEVVEPEAVDTGLPKEKQEEVAAAREQLIKLLVDDVKRTSPQQLARTQLLFDCWQHELSKNLDQEKAPCADEFRSTLSQLQEVSDVFLYGKETRRVIAFNREGTKLDEAAQETITTLAHRVTGMSNYRIQLQIYHGKKLSQRRLTDARVNVVRKALVAAGVKDSRIHVKKTDNSKAVILSSDNLPVLDTKKIVIVLKTHQSKD